MRKQSLKNLLILAAAGFVIFFVGCSKSTNVIFQHSLNKYDYVIAESDNGYKLTMPDFYERIANSKFLVTGGIADTGLINELVDSVVIDSLIGLRSDTVNIRNHYEYYFRLREATQRHLVNSFYDHAIFKNVNVDSQDVIDYYISNPEEFVIKEQVLVSHILIAANALKKGPDSPLYEGKSPEELEQLAKQKAFALRDSIKTKEEFEDMARKYSHDAVTGRSGGFIGWAERNMYAKPFDSIAFAAESDEVVGPYRDRDGWHILYVAEHIEPGISPLTSNAYASALYSVQMEMSKGFARATFDTLLDSIDIEYNEDVLDTNVYKVDKDVWAAVINKNDTIDFGIIRNGEESIRSKYKVSNSTVPMKKEFLRFLANRITIVQAARKLGLDTLPDFKELVGNTKHKLARLIIEDQRTDAAWEPTQEMMKQYYDTHLENYVVERPLKVQQIVVSELSLAQFIKDQANSGVDFMQLASEYYPGEESVRAELANLGWVGPDDVSKEFFDAAMITRVKEVSDPVKTEYGYHLIRVIEKKISVPFEQARAGIRVILKKEREAKEVAEFEAGLKAEFNLVRTGRVYPIHFKPYDQRQVNQL